MSKVSFGFRSVEIEKKQGLVNEVFDHVASRYDIMNDVMSAGMHRIWKNHFVNLIPHKSPLSILDVAGGTGDITRRILACYPQAKVTLADINPAMLQKGKQYIQDHNIKGYIELLCTNAEDLPLPDASIDVYTIAFGIRNVTSREKALSEAYRVLKPGGKWLCLEFSEVTNPIIQQFYDVYSFHCIPSMGRIITGSADPYQYLVESIRTFPNQEQFKKEIQQVGFEQVKYTNYTHGVVAVHSGWKI